MEIKDTYKTLAGPSEETLLKEKNSKFFGYAFPVTNEDEVKAILADLKKQHYGARHWCYAFQLGCSWAIVSGPSGGGPARQSISTQVWSLDVYLMFEGLRVRAAGNSC